jgi:DNA mismatch endonuclease (patch repair protein)
MPDKFTKEIRRKTMQAVKSRDTKLENDVIRELWSRGIRFRRNVNDLRGKPDIAIKKWKIVIFIDSCFWHGCEIHYRAPETHEDFWRRKIARNRTRDLETINYYINNNWHILRVWEHELSQDFKGTIEKIVIFVNQFRH